MIIRDLHANALTTPYYFNAFPTHLRKKLIFALYFDYTFLYFTYFWRNYGLKNIKTPDTNVCTWVNSIATSQGPQCFSVFNLPHLNLPRLASTASNLPSTESGNPQSARPRQLPWSEATTSTTDQAWPLRCQTEEVRQSGRRPWVHCS